ncbi:Metallothionein-like protein 3B [Cocos nucifera]|uniref:Metallothionein-like protein 3B n=1 Tax=Cocos nucifera TaxID=13894 RepID=A0A8K0MVY8_COCNU|nr:Metallothionein-like protein 3B [Cocos nucifera]
MSSCGNCDCADKSQCQKKGNSYGIVIVETEKSHFGEVMEITAAMETDCKCSSNCTCAGCNCGK